jgi:hypothetical protein
MWVYHLIGQVYQVAIRNGVTSIGGDAFSPNIVTIGANVNIEIAYDRVVSQFVMLYNQMGKKAGTYQRSNPLGWVYRPWP